ncbi:helix-turn-helix domain-containing protein [Pedobacter petrophilus]|uniref:Helix-turn-helix domain-containing protein n=1 Tax=Pedobacter petrophilus TaxID=1908241 RepID=A0A7K0FW62_9SPHI|nr:AraC family transcriptional regulator [Pedobacter petrophilus]MRX75837.1 helix-turn-helix domain-containing protein [Pedobacter petrophilus]
MKIRLLEYHTQTTVYENTYGYNFDINGDLEESKQEIRTENYQVNLSEKWFNGIHISTAEIITQNAQDFYYESSQQHIGFLFCLNGSISYFNDAKTKHLLSLNHNQQNISAGQFNRVVFNISGKASYTYIQLTESYFSKVTNQCFIEQNGLTQNAITPEIELLLRTFEHPNYNGRMKRIFLESKIFELIISYLQKKEVAAVSIKEEDVRKILFAKQLIESNLQHPCSLMELSRKAGINDYKLKKGFKTLIGYTVFGYLYKIRMERAHYFLLHEKKSVNEVAFLVGYKNAQHFISAFKKHYALLPGSLNKNF